jgi:hypothetical protein
LQVTLEAGSTFSDLSIRDIERLRDSLANKYALLLIIAATDRVAIDSADYAAVLRLAHHFAFRRFIIERASISTYTSEVVEAGREFAGGGSLIQLANSLNEKSTNAAFAARFREASARNNKEGFYVCEMIEHHLGSSAGMLPNPQSPTQHVEHIFPKKPESGAWPPVPPDKLLDDYVNRFGNLLVLEGDINRRVKNHSYAIKQSNPEGLDYSHSALKMPHQLGPFEKDGGWSFESIVERQNWLVAQFAEAIWGLEA